MEMRRRTFLKSILIVAGTGAGSLWCTTKKRCGKFVRAVKSKCYPGKVDGIPDIDTIGKWSG